MDKEELQTLRSRILFRISIGVLILLAISIGTGFYWANTEYDPLIFRDQDNKPIDYIIIGNPKKQVLNGGYIILVPNFCKTIDASGDTVAELVGPTLKTDLNWPRETSKKGCYNVPITFRLPTVTNLEPRKLCFHTTYRPNPIRTVEENVCTEQIIIVSEDEVSLLRPKQPSPTTPPMPSPTVFTQFSQAGTPLTINNNIPPDYIPLMTPTPTPPTTPPTPVPTPTTRLLCLLKLCL